MKQKLRKFGIAAGGALLGAATIVSTNLAEKSEASVSEVLNVASEAPQVQNTRRETAKKAQKVLRNSENSDDVAKKEKLKKQQEAEDKFVETAHAIKNSLPGNADYETKVTSESTPDGVNFAAVEVTVYGVVKVYLSLPNPEDIDPSFKYNISYYIKGGHDTLNIKSSTFEELMENIRGQLSLISID